MTARIDLFSGRGDRLQLWLRCEPIHSSLRNEELLLGEPLPRFLSMANDSANVPKAALRGGTAIIPSSIPLLPSTPRSYGQSHECMRVFLRVRWSDGCYSGLFGHDISPFACSSEAFLALLGAVEKPSRFALGDFCFFRSFEHLTQRLFVVFAE
jgi:hypothetical protein